MSLGTVLEEMDALIITWLYPRVDQEGALVDRRLPRRIQVETQGSEQRVYLDFALTI